MSPLLKKLSLFLYLLLLAGVVAWCLFTAPSSLRSQGKARALQLTRGSLTVLDFPAKIPRPTAIVIFGSGDGGWDTLEEAIALALQDHGYEVIGIDSSAYARSDYDLDILQSDYSKIGQEAQASYPGVPPPIIVGGFSMGAAQAVAATGGPHPPLDVAGLLLVDPCSRGRYGLRTSDRMDMVPTGPGTFSMEDFSQKMGNLRIVQWHAEGDSIDSTAWLKSLTAEHEEFDFPNEGHEYTNNRDEFVRQLVSSAGWITDSARRGKIATREQAYHE